MKTKKIFYVSFLIILGIIILTSCGKDRSPTTGWNYNDPKNGGFEVQYYTEQETGPGLIFIEGGSFVMGRTEQELMYDWNNVPRKVTVSSFYMDETEITNVAYREYLYWLTRVFGTDYPEVYKKALPDTLVWRSRLGYNEPYVELYFRHPAYQNYPVVGVNWLQANDYCAWRTDRVNEEILIREGILQVDPNQVNEENFNTDAYLAGQYEGLVKDELYSYNPNVDTRKVMVEDGIFLPRYRLPTEAEWEFAALGLIGNTVDERILERRLYPWSGHFLRNDEKGNQGKFMANFVRGRGDYMGVAGALNDKADIPGPVKFYWPNDYGLYCMAGNVNEWVMDIYRPMTLYDFDEFRGFRGNVFKTQVRDEEGAIAEKDSLGRIQWRDVTEQEVYDRRNFNYADNINYNDGDYESSINYGEGTRDQFLPGTGSQLVYAHDFKKYHLSNLQTDLITLINDNVRIYKGGSWRDRAYWMSPGTRRFLDEKQATDDIGFRCAMFRVGSPVSW